MLQFIIRKGASANYKHQYGVCQKIIVFKEAEIKICNSKINAAKDYGIMVRSDLNHFYWFPKLYLLTF